MVSEQWKAKNKNKNKNKNKAKQNKKQGFHFYSVHFLHSLFHFFHSFSFSSFHFPFFPFSSFPSLFFLFFLLPFYIFFSFLLHSQFFISFPCLIFPDQSLEVSGWKVPGGTLPPLLHLLRHCITWLHSLLSFSWVIIVDKWCRRLMFGQY